MVEVGTRVPHELFGRGPAALRAWVERAEGLGLDHVCVGDHVSFRDGAGYDGLLQAAAVAAASTSIAVHTAVYVLPLRHPVVVARQVASLAELIPGRFVFGVGIGGEDRHEMEVCGVDPATRGRRMDESLPIVQRLLRGEETTHDGEFFRVTGARLLPAADPAVPVLVGGRSGSAIRRAGLAGDGWYGLWVSPERFAATTSEVESVGVSAGRTGVVWRHSLIAWCGIAADSSQARRALAPAMEALYGVPFERFARYCPTGSPEQVAQELAPYVDWGCRSISLIAKGDGDVAVLDGVAEVARLLRAHAATSGSPSIR